MEILQVPSIPDYVESDDDPDEEQKVTPNEQ